MKKKTIEKQIEIFRLELTGTGEIDKLRAAAYIRSLIATAQRDPTNACRHLDQSVPSAELSERPISRPPIFGFLLHKQPDRVHRSPRRCFQGCFRAGSTPPWVVDAIRKGCTLTNGSSDSACAPGAA